MASHYNLRGSHSTRNTSSIPGGDTPVSPKIGESGISTSPLTPVSPSISMAMPGVESTPLLYSRVVSPTIPPVKMSSAPIDIASFESSMGNHGSDNLLLSTQPSIGNNGSGDLLLSTSSPTAEGSSDGQLAVYYDSFDGIEGAGLDVPNSNP